MIGPKIPLTLSQHMVTGMMDVQSFLWVLGHRPPRRQCTALSEKAHTLEHMEEKAPLQSSCHPPAQGDSRAPLTCDLQGITIGKTRIPCETQAWVSQNAVAAYQLPHQLRLGLPSLWRVGREGIKRLNLGSHTSLWLTASGSSSLTRAAAAWLCCSQWCVAESPPKSLRGGREWSE